MISYIASNSTSDLIENICNKLDITILNKEVEKRIDFFKYIKQTKVNFNLIKYFIIEISCLDNSEEEIIRSIYNFSNLYIKTRIIIIARGLDCQNKILTGLYEKNIYNIINSIDDKEIQQQISKALSKEGIQKKDAKQFKKIEEVKNKNNKFEKVRQLVINIVNKLKKYSRIDKTKIKNILRVCNISSQQPKYIIFLDIIIKLVKLIYYILLTFILLAILLNSQVRNIIFQIGLK